nr:hypothetical protein BaRGS_005670 [Batillaria attramentaria]
MHGWDPWTCLQDELEDFLPKINMEPRVSDEDRCDAICTQIVHWFGLRCMPLLFHVLAWCLVVPKLVIGGLYLHDCPVEPKLPIYLIVSAFIPVALYLCCCGGVYCEGKMVVCIIVAVPILFMLAWLGAGLALLFVLFVIIIFVEIIAKLVIGALFLGHCDAEPRLPVFVLVSGFVPFIIICCPGCEHHRRCNLVSRVVELLLMLGWLGGGVLLYVLTKRTLDECQQTAAEMPERERENEGELAKFKSRRGTFCVLFLFIALIIVMGITKLVIGGLFYHDCAVEPKLPIYLIVSAIVPMTFQFCCQWCKKNAEMVYTIGVLVLFLFNIAWLAAAGL